MRALGRTRRFVDQQPGVLGQALERTAQLSERIARKREIAATLAELERCRGLPRAAHQAQLERALLDAARLAHPAAVEPDEIRALGIQAEEQRLARAQRALEPLGEREEPLFHPPPKTSTPEKTQAGAAWPQCTAWFGSPLPQFSVPCTSKVDGSPTMRRLRQNVADTPR